MSNAPSKGFIVLHFGERTHKGDCVYEIFGLIVSVKLVSWESIRVAKRAVVVR